MARPTKLTDEAKEAIVKAIGIGAPKNIAAQAAGIHYDTFNEWMKRGEACKSGKFAEFSEAVRRAEGEAFLKYISTVAQSAANGDARTAIEFLKRRDPANWGDRMKFDLSKCNDDELLRLLAVAERLEAKSRGGTAGADTTEQSDSTEDEA